MSASAAPRTVRRARPTSASAASTGSSRNVRRGSSTRDSRAPPAPARSVSPPAVASAAPDFPEQLATTRSEHVQPSHLTPTESELVRLYSEPTQSQYLDPASEALRTERSFLPERDEHVLRSGQATQNVERIASPRRQNTVTFQELSGYYLEDGFQEAALLKMEHEREDLGHMQWKLVRDQLAGLGDKIAKLGRSVEELGEFVLEQRHEHDIIINSLRTEMGHLIHSESDVLRNHGLQFSDRIEGVAHNLHSERYAREMLQQSLEKQIQGVRDEVDLARSRGRAQGNGEASVLEELRHAITNEGEVRAAAEDRMWHEMRCLGERLDMMATQNSERAQDVDHELLQVSSRTHEWVQDLIKQITGSKIESETWQHQADMRFSVMQSGMTKTEGQLIDCVNRQTSMAEDFWKRLNKLYGMLEETRLSERARKLSQSCPSLPKADELLIEDSQVGFKPLTDVASQQAPPAVAIDPALSIRPSADMQAPSGTLLPSSSASVPVVMSPRAQTFRSFSEASTGVFSSSRFVINGSPGAVGEFGSAAHHMPNYGTVVRTAQMQQQMQQALGPKVWRQT